MRKVTDQLSSKELSRLVSDLEDLSTSSIPIATEKLLELGATAAQMGIQTAAGIEAAAVAGAKLEQATDVAGSAAVTGLTRIIRIQGEMISSIGQVGSALVALGNDSALFESEILKVTNELARSTANFKIGTPAGHVSGSLTPLLPQTSCGSVTHSSVPSHSLNGGGSDVNLRRIC